MTGPHRWLTSWLRSCARKRSTARFDYQKGISSLVARSRMSRTLAHSLRLRSGIRRHVDTRACTRDAGVVRQASNDCAANKFGGWLPDCNHSADDFIGEQRKNAIALKRLS